MHPFEQTISVIGPIVGAIIVLTIFFQVVGWLNRRAGGGPTQIALRGILDKSTRATVHLSTGAMFQDVRIIGFIDSGSAKMPFPYDLQSMVILEHADGKRILVHPKLIRMIEVPPKGD
jgi:hypothetical protein